jgi:hypothetical protein
MAAMFGFATDQQQADLTAPEKVVATAEVLFSEEREISCSCVPAPRLPGDCTAESPGCRFWKGIRKNQHAQQTGQKNRTQQRNPEYAFTRPFKKDELSGPE